jgi:hypothetical protein
MSYVEIFYELAELKDKEDFTDYKEGCSSSGPVSDLEAVVYRSRWLK